MTRLRTGAAGLLNASGGREYDRETDDAVKTYTDNLKQ